MDFVSPLTKWLESHSTEASEDYSQADIEGWGVGNVQLRSYQLDGVKWLLTRLKMDVGCLLGDEMGLGKTLQSISLLANVYSSGELRPSLVLAPLSVIDNWSTELSRFAPGLKVTNYSGSKEQRQETRAAVSHSRTSGHPFQIMLANYEVVIKDSAFLQKIPWRCLIVDEGHRLKNSNSVLYNLLSQFDVGFRLLLTGTPVQNTLSELYALLSFVAAKFFPLSKMDHFLTSFSDVNDENVAKTLHTVLEPFLLRRTKNEVLADLPNKSEVVLYTGLSSVQKKYYKAILMKDLAAFGDSGSRTRLMNILVQLRKCVNHPYLFDGVEPEPFELGEHLVEASGKLFIIDKLLKHLKPRGHRVLLFSQMTRMLDIIQDYLGYRGYSYERLDGSVRGEERFIALKNFSKDDQTFIFLLSTRAGGQGLNLAGADTIIFVDSDFNPQNDLQAAARAHRLGQTRPVKVIRLVSRHTMEEIILKRALAKLELTQTVIEGGQFSHGAAGLGAADGLSELIKYGLDNLLQSEETTLVDEDLESVVGGSEKGRWLVAPVRTTPQDLTSDTEGPENMYMYEGEDYSRCSDSDKKSFEQLLAEQLKVAEGGLGERVLRGKRQVLVSLPDLASRKRPPLTPEQLAERRRKREEARAKRIKLLEEKEQQKMEEKRRKKLAFWERNDYTSLSPPLDSDSDDHEEDVGVDIEYLVGDATRPQNTGSDNAIVLHCVDDSGRWGRGGVFSALSSRSPQPQTQYELAGRMRDLELGQSHIVPIDDVMRRELGDDFVALMVAQRRGSGIQLSALSVCLQRVAQLAIKQKASVHLPRIGHSTPNFNWYGTERLIRKHLTSRGVPTFIYYFPRANTPHTSPPSLSPAGASLLPKGCSPLPDLFTDLSFYLHELGPDTHKNLARYIVAYNGDLCETVTDTTTHILCDKHVGTVDTRSAVVLDWKWIEECLKCGRLVPTERFTSSS